MVRFLALVIVGAGLGFAPGNLPIPNRQDAAYAVLAGLAVLAVRVIFFGTDSDDRLYRRLAKTNPYGRTR
jgi:hypothetical protein